MRRIYHRLVIVTALILSPGYPARSEPPAADAKPIHTDLYGDPLPLGALTRLGTERFRHGYAVTSVTFSPDGKTAASGGQGNGIHIWDAITGKKLVQLGGRKSSSLGVNGFDAIAFSPDGSKIVAGGAVPASVLWDIRTGKEILQLQGQQGRVFCVAYSPDGQTIATGGWDRTVRLWDTTTGQELRRLEGHRAWVRGVAFSPDGTILASCAGTIRLWDGATGTELRRCEGHRFEVDTVAFSPDGKLLASGGHDKTIRIWEVASGKELKQWDGQQFFVFCVAFSPDGKALASAGLDGTIRLWHTATGLPIRVLQGHEGPVCCVVYSPDGKVLASASGDKMTWGGRDKIVRLWDVATGKELRPTGGHQLAVTSAAFFADGRTVATGSQDGTVRLWNAATGEELHRYYNIALSEATKSHERNTPGEASPQSVQAVALTPDGRTLAWAGPRICLRDTVTGMELRRLGSSKEPVSCIAFSPNGKILAAGNPLGWVRVYDVATGQELRLFAGGYGGIVSLSFSPDGRSLAMAHDRSDKLTVWEVATGNRLLTIQASHDPLTVVNSVAFFANGRKLVSGLAALNTLVLEDNLYLWDASTGQRIGSLKGQFGQISAVAISPDGKTLASASGNKSFFGGSDQTIRLWEIATGKERCCFQGHLSGIPSIAFAPDGKSLVSAGEDTTAMVWDVTGLANRRPLKLAIPVRDLESHWRDLAQADAARAHSIIWALTASPQHTLAFLKDRLRPASPVDRKQVEELITELASDRFPVRQQATQELGKLADLAEVILRQKLEERIPLETRQRLQRLLEKSGPSDSLERLREVRAIETLEHIGTSEATEVLRKLATGTSEALLTKEAKASLDRLAKRSAGTP